MQQFESIEDIDKSCLSHSPKISVLLQLCLSWKTAAEVLLLAEQFKLV